MLEIEIVNGDSEHSYTCSLFSSSNPTIFDHIHSNVRPSLTARFQNRGASSILVGEDLPVDYDNWHPKHDPKSRKRAGILLHSTLFPCLYGIGYDEDPNFIHSDNDVVSDQDDMLYDSNVTDGIEVGLGGSERGVEDELIEGNDSDGWFRAELEPVDEYSNAVGNEQENTISKRVPRRKGSSSTHNPLGGPKWQFMPTSMATKETQTGSLTVGPAATFTNVNVPTTEINFEVIIDELRPLKRQNRRG
ncbi:4-alpha-glucanotransferase, chloroplastic amyloplastic [Olea europaea subsp. europaea]|uniref:4-alpha-glucanotransferase, chloroplastic amyloplastic n=1 Tax=Olea europaea subsp. europaea TaxID=158383 RepID=A0A8S0RUP2_OLEEU|nr:4-alpha-glucanotransferase, chloroplastic amyloplastic [Olea europaea subsp. europaea]